MSLAIERRQKKLYQKRIDRVIWDPNAFASDLLNVYFEMNILSGNLIFVLPEIALSQTVQPKKSFSRKILVWHFNEICVDSWCLLIEPVWISHNRIWCFANAHKNKSTREFTYLLFFFLSLLFLLLPFDLLYDFTAYVCVNDWLYSYLAAKFADTSSSIWSLHIKWVQCFWLCEIYSLLLVVFDGWIHMCTRLRVTKISA